MYNSIEKYTPEERRKLVESILRSGTCRRGRRKISALVPIDLMEVDTTYQRPMKNNILINSFDLDRCAAVTLGVREDKSAFWIIDGQNRAYAAMKNGIYELEAEIFEGTTVDEESEMFAMQNKGTKKLNEYDIFRANLASGGRNNESKIAILVKRTTDKYSIIADGSRKSGHLSGLKQAQEIVESSGVDCLEWIFDVIKKSNWHNKKDAYISRTLKSLEFVYNSAKSIYNREKYKMNLITTLSQVDARDIVAYSMDAYGDGVKGLKQMARLTFTSIATGAVNYYDVIGKLSNADTPVVANSTVISNWVDGLDSGIFFTIEDIANNTGLTIKQVNNAKDYNAALSRKLNNLFIGKEGGAKVYRS